MHIYLHCLKYFEGFVKLTYVYWCYNGKEVFLCFEIRKKITKKVFLFGTIYINKLINILNVYLSVRNGQKQIMF